MSQNLLDTAKRYHESLPPRIRTYLNSRGIPDATIERFLLGWDGKRITIPITNRDGDVVFFKLAKDPEEKSPGPKMLASEGSTVELYGWENVRAKAYRVIICEGEFDRLVLEAMGFPAVTSTGGVATFRKEWAGEFRDIPEIYVCFDRDRAGVRGLLRIAKLIPHARAVELPEDVGDGGDVTDFFVRLGRTREDFERLLADARPVPPAVDEEAKPQPGGASSSARDLALRERVDVLKHAVPVELVVGDRIPLRPSGSILVGLCPLHDDGRPSLAVYPRSGRFYCFGCGKGGDVITFLREVDHLTFNQALEVLEALQDHHGRKAA